MKFGLYLASARHESVCNQRLCKSRRRLFEVAVGQLLAVFRAQELSIRVREMCRIGKEKIGLRHVRGPTANAKSVPS